MSIITGALPDSVEFEGKSYAVHTDFRRWIAFFEAAGERDLVGMLKVYRELPPSADTAVALALGFGNGAALPYGGGGKRAVLDFETDAALIYAGFMGEYGIDLCEASLHWYKFCALLAGLGQDRRISQIMELRAEDAGLVQDKARRRRLRELQRNYAIPDRRSAQEKDGGLVRCLGEFY